MSRIRTDFGPFITEGEYLEAVAEIEKREAAWKNLAMLYRRKIARYRNQIVQLGEAPKADEKIDGGIERFEKQLDCAPNIVRLGGGDGLMGGASD